MRTFGRDAIVDRESSKQRKENEYQCRDRRQDAGGRKRNARLVAKSRKIINARQAHYLPPGVFVMDSGLLMRGFRLPDAVHQPTLQASIGDRLTRIHRSRGKTYASASRLRTKLRHDR